MLDLEALADTCREQNRWTFFFTSAPANVPGKTSLFLLVCSNLNFLASTTAHAGINSIYLRRRRRFSCERYRYLLSGWASHPLAASHKPLAIWAQPLSFGPKAPEDGID